MDRSYSSLGLGLKLFLAVAAVTLIANASETLLVVAAAVLAAFPVCYLSRRFNGDSRFSQAFWSTVILFCAAVSFLIFVGFVGGQFRQQAQEFQQKLPTLIDQARSEVSDYPVLQNLWNRTSQEMESGEIGNFGQVRVLFSGTLGLLSSILLFGALTLYLIYQHEMYESGLERLLDRAVGENRRRRLSREVSEHMWGFLAGQLRAMSVIAVLTTLGLWWLDMPLYLALGLTAGLLAFVPVLGPLVSTVPALLVAIPEGTAMVFWVLALYGGIQLLESNLITPMIQQGASELPPALTLTFQAVMGTLAGPLGVLMAAPTAVVAMVLGKEWIGELSPSGDKSAQNHA